MNGSLLLGYKTASATMIRHYSTGLKATSKKQHILHSVQSIFNYPGSTLLITNFPSNICLQKTPRSNKERIAASKNINVFTDYQLQRVPTRFETKIILKTYTA